MPEPTIGLLPLYSMQPVDLVVALKATTERLGIPQRQAVRDALRVWLDQHQQVGP
jgi:hypothetical protein